MNENHNQSPAQLKALARTSLTGKYPFMIGVLLVSSVIFSLFSMPLSMDGGIVSYLFSFFASFLWELFLFHIYRINLLVCCRQPATLRDLLLGNPEHEKEMQTVYAACILAVIQFLCILPADLLSSFYQSSGSAVLFLGTCILYTLGLLIYICIYISIFPIYFLTADCPAATIGDTVKMAFYLSKGNRFRLLYLMVSFLPLLLLSLLSCGIGLLWIIPYMNATLTHFYLKLASTKSAG